MNTLNFPVKRFKYYEFYTSSIKSAFELTGDKIILDPDLDYAAPAAFYIKVNNKLAFIDFSDYEDEWNYGFKGNKWFRINKMYEPEKMNVPIFKRTVRKNKKYENNIFPLGPFYASDNTTNKDLKYLLSMGNVYDPFKNNGIFKRNRVYSSAVATRKIAFQKIDKTKLLPEVEFLENRVSQHQFWEQHRNCLSSLNISGASPHSQDCGAIEAMFLGVCPIANDFDILLPYNEELQKGVHYIWVQDGYANINECLNFPYDNRSICKDMGTEAYELMMKTASPTNRVNWIVQTIEEYYK